MSNNIALRNNTKSSNQASLNNNMSKNIATGSNNMQTGALSFVTDLSSERDFWSMKCRIIRVWKLKWRWELILLDERGGKVQAVVKSPIFKELGDRLKEDAVLVLRNFGMAKQEDKYPVLNLKNKVNFYKGTSVEAVKTWPGHPYCFDFKPFTDVLQSKPSDFLTVDVIGRIAHAGNLEVFKSAGKESRRINLELQDLDFNVLKCTLWGDYADQCTSFFSANESSEMVILALQHGRVREWGGVNFVQNDMFGSRLFLNEELPEANDLRRSMILKLGPSSSQTVLSSQVSYPLRDEFVIQTPKKTVQEILEVDKPSSFVALASISMVEQQHGWFYKAHRKCGKKAYTKKEFLERSNKIPDHFLNAPFDSLWCMDCNDIADSLIPKFKVQFRVQDNTGSVSFVMFDKEVIKVLGLTAADVRDRQLKSADLDTFPNEVVSMENKVLAFKIIISAYNLENKYHVYTVTKLCDDDEVIKELQAKEATEEVSRDEVDQVAVKLDESSQLAIEAKDCVSVTGSSSAIEVEKDSATSPVVKRELPKLEGKAADEGSAVRPVKKKLCH